MLSKAFRRDQRNWDEILPLLMLAYRSSEHESTGFTPCMMMFGREAELPVDLVYGLPPIQDPFTHTEYVVRLSERLDKINKLASNQMALVRERQKRQYDIKINKTQYPVGSLVWLHDPTTKKGLCRKLQLPWEGPYQVIQILSDIVYAIKLSKHTKPKIVHHDRLKAYFGEPET